MPGESFPMFFVMVTALAFALCIYPAEAQIVEEGLLGYWPFDADTIEGDTVKDVSGNGNHGVINFDVKIAEGKVGDALEFGDADDHYVLTELMITEANHEKLTMMGWAKPYKVHDSYGQLMGGDDGGWDRGLGYRADVWEICVGHGGDWQPGEVADINEWQHVAVIYTPDNVLFYKNGERFEFGERTTPTTSVQPFMIGDDIPCGPNCTFPGAIDEVMVYGRALTDAEVVKNMTAEGSPVDSNGKLALTWGKIKALR